MKKDNFRSPDFYSIDTLFNEEQLLVRNAVREWVKENVSPIIEECALSGNFPDHLIVKLAEIGGFGGFLPSKYGGAEIDYTSYGLMMQELERGDSSIRVLSSVQSLVMNSIYSLGSEKQKLNYLPKLSSGEIIGSFGMSEPNHGSDPSSMKSHYEEKEDYYLINGSKMWIGHAPICNLALVWAKGPSNTFGGFIVERNTEGFSTAKIEKKWSFRASETGELIFQNMKVPKENLLVETDDIKDLFNRLNIGRFGVAWGTLGIAMECYDVALKYSSERKQFGNTINSYQLVQKKLVDMLTEITKSQVLTWRLGLLMDKGEASFEQISLAKKVNVKMACEVAKKSRSVLGGMGITGEYPIMRHINNLEALVTYQGTDEIHTLIIGKKVTGISAIK
ncbi:MAG: acyl-CoA dehydrogenase [Marinoscillum sp.]|nr:acyl-CoA dehydrogenase [Marinoscillum sp.]OUX26223.1 MAG: acyl-CoA dehydrogenase [Flammeovirgaceae bacterium TMED262]|tara:strand:+ start:22474 stop:23649 length:1176 start_codon:yes stop_codon:yes gene_type:complete